MDSLFDAHVHFNRKAKDPIRDFEAHFSRNNLTHAVLILNTKEEIALFEENHQELRDFAGDRIVAAGIFDTGGPVCGSQYARWRDWGFRTCIKLHPRISNLTKGDFGPLAEKLAETEESPIIIDCFGYGHHLENHIGVELGIFLAERFPERTVVLAHAGGHRALECMLYTRTLKNIGYDLALSCNYLSGTSVWADLAHLVKFNPAKVMFGSDYPDFSQEAALEGSRRLCAEAGLDEEKQNLFFFENARKVYCG